MKCDASDHSAHKQAKNKAYQALGIARAKLNQENPVFAQPDSKNTAIAAQPKNNDAAITAWQDYIDRQVPMVIYPAPKSLSDKDNQFVAAPAESPRFWMGGYSTQEAAISFCTRNKLEFSIHSKLPTKMAA